jgi:flagellar hook-basal body complex protein FliE
MIDGITNGLRAAPAVGAADAAVLSESQLEAAGKSSFGEMMAGLLSDAAGALRTGEAKSIAAMRGEGSIQDAVEAVMRAEQQMQATLAIRDKVVAAYLDLSRQQI